MVARDQEGNVIWGLLRGDTFISGAARVLACLALPVVLALPGAPRAEEPVPPPRPSLNLFGMTGLIDMPTAEMQPDAQFNFTSSYFGGSCRASRRRSAIRCWRTCCRGARRFMTAASTSSCA
jgi:hypothetical protein